MTAGLGSELIRDRLAFRAVAFVINALLSVELRFMQALAMGRGSARGAAALGLPRRRRRVTGHGNGQVLGTEYILNQVIRDALASPGPMHGPQVRVASLAKVLAVVAILLVPSEATATPVTPDDVSLVVGAINAELALLHESNDSTPAVDINAPDLTPRRPRHVLQKAREVMLKVQLLRKINGLPERNQPPMPLREVRPADVKEMVELIRRDLTALRNIFGVTKAPISIPRPSGKTPTDVYRDLVRAGAQLDGLGIPKIVPNDVYRIALTIVADLEKLRGARGLTAAVPAQSGSKDKRPGDVYAKAFELLLALGVLTSEQPGFGIPGGTVPLNRRSGRIEPAHVMDLLNNILAEISAIKVKVGVKGLTEFAPPQAGKTPSHVYDPVSTALILVETLE